MEPIRWGILTAGNISNQFAKGLQVLPDAEIVAVGSSSQAKSDEFADKYDIPHRHEGYEALVNDPDVDVIYIGSPHSHHYDHMKLCLNAGKHVICEKAFTLNAAQAEECINLAQEKGLFLMEAMWTRYLPAVVQLRQWLADGVIGTPEFVQIDFSFYKAFEAAHRLYNPDLGGGALLDLGIYNVSFASMVLGLPDRVHSHMMLAESGVDRKTSMMLEYDNGATAMLMCGFVASLPRDAFISGTKGWIQVKDPFYKPTQLVLHLNGEDAQTFEFPIESTGYQFEAAEVMSCIRAGKLESDVMPLAETLALMQLMDEIREPWGVKYAVAGEE